MMVLNMSFEIIREEEYQNCKKITISTIINNKTITERFGFSWDKINSGIYVDMINSWIEKQKLLFEKKEE